MSVVGEEFIIGTSDFDEIIEKNALFVDKTLLIKEFIEGSAEVVNILRPHRFGKSTNLSMLRSFLSIGSDPNRFQRYLIFKEEKFMDQHCGKYPVVFLDLKDIKGDNWDEMLCKISLYVGKLVNTFSTVLNSKRSHSDQLDFDAFTSLTADKGLLTTSLSFLIKQLCKIYQRRVIVLIDEYDSPLNNAFQKGFYDNASSFFTTFFSSALKGNSALEKACLVGVVGIGSGPDLTGLNNVVFYNIAREKYSTFFGFTTEEIRFFISDEKTLDEVLNWYSGYWIGSKQLLNPWSFLLWLKKKEFKSHWVEMANIENLFTFLHGHKQLFIEILHIVFSGDPLDVSGLRSVVDYSKNAWGRKDGILHFLVHAGYLTYRKGVNQRGEVFIPNNELHLLWKVDIFPFIKKEMNSEFILPLQKAFTAKTFCATALQNLMRNLVEYPSFQNTTSEINYQKFFYCLFLGVLQDKESVQVESNKENGYDIKLDFLNLKRIFIFEFKKSENEASLEREAKKALEQIIEKEHYHSFTNRECILIGISFLRKKMSNFEVKIIDPSNF